MTDLLDTEEASQNKKKQTNKQPKTGPQGVFEPPPPPPPRLRACNNYIFHF